MKFSALAKGETLEMNFFGFVGDDWAEDGISYKRVSKALRDAPNANTIKIRANSFGGAAMEGHAIRSLLSASGKRIEMDIDGVAASAMSVIAMAADHIRIAADAQFMIHNSRTVAAGTADQIRSDIQALENLDDAMVSVYAARTKQSQRQVREWMEAETWFSAKEAVEHGFADEITPAKGAKAQASARFNFKALPEKFAAELQQVQIAPTVTQVEQESTQMTPDQIKQAIAEAMAPFLAQLQAPAPVQAPVQAPAVEPEVEVLPVVTDEQAEIRAMFDAAVVGAFERYSASGKLVPAARESFVAACATPTTFRAVCKMYDAAPAMVNTAPVSIPVVKPAGDVPTAQQVSFLRKAAGKTDEQIKALYPGFVPEGK